ncbi:glycosyltransferase family 39 protein [Nonomuraea sp. bgisy101]|uniref:glycosyltransferase family 39 protein n=1 Tax=Nonomuraea sp. bgisy101 TaxID=3413784 RepID=UPI003D706FB9
MTVTAQPPSPGAEASRGWPARALLGPVDDPRWSRPALWGVLAVAFVLYAWALSGMANEYYAAAILSGTKSWKAFFFGALDAGSFITVDKPPLALWVMGLSARVFGFGTWSMLLPQAVAGVAAVAVVSSAVRRSAGHAAGLVAALVMTLTPITVAINRDNNPDTVLVLLLVTGAWFALEAVRRGRPRSLLLCALFVGLAFNTKMLQAYLVVPAFALAYAVFARAPFAKRLLHLSAAGVVLVASSAWWMVIVDLWPAASRPYVGGSTDNSVWDLVIGYNGLGRIFGQGGGRGGPSFGGEPGAGRLFNDVMAGQISWLLPFCAVALVFAAARWRALRGQGAAWAVWGGWLLVHYAVFSFSSGTFHPYYATAMAPAVAAVTGMGGVLMWRAYGESRAWAWVLPASVALTGAWAFVALRRTPSFVPWLAWAVAAAAALAVAVLIVAALGAGAPRAGGSCAGGPRASGPWAGAPHAGGSGRRGPWRPAAWAVAVALLAGLAGPAAYAVTPLSSPVNGTNPTAGPSGGADRFGGGPGGSGAMGRPPAGQQGQDGPPPTGQSAQSDQTGQSGEAAQLGQSGWSGQSGEAAQDGQPGWSGQDGRRGESGQGGQDAGRMRGGGPGWEISDELTAYLKEHRNGATWLVAVGSAGQASSLILETGEPVIAMGGFTGADPAMTADRLRELVSSGQLTYVLAGGGGGRDGGSAEVTAWVEENCPPVEGQEGLYRCSP